MFLFRHTTSADGSGKEDEGLRSIPCQEFLPLKEM
jgi:hypothetical protein